MIDPFHATQQQGMYLKEQANGVGYPLKQNQLLLSDRATL